MRPGRLRLFALLFAAAILLTGLAVRAWTGGAFAKYTGVALYAALGYALVAAVAPRLAPLRVAAIALALCWAIELAQLSPVPAALSARSTLARLALGSTFNPPDLAWYAVGVGVAWTIHAAIRMRSSAFDDPHCHRHGRASGWPGRSTRAGRRA
jgi:hypothetical protein